MIVENYSNIKFHENPYKTDGQTDRHVTKLIVAFLSFSKVLTKECINFYGETISYF
jgi:hypothetical protein